MKTPAFWRTDNTLTKLLSPLSAIYGALSGVKESAGKKVDVPVICVGNLIAGGAGKTPVALHVGKLLADKGAFFLSRGYKGRIAGPVRVDTRRYGASEVGDEPLLLARVLPTIGSRDRLAGAKLAIEQGAKIIVMDDGFQNFSLHKDLSLLVVDSEIGFGNGRLLPAGPLRESPQHGFARADAILVIGDGKNTPALPEGKPVLRARIKPVTAFPAGRKMLAFCGLAWPHKFYDTLQSLGVELVDTVSFADHHDYTGPEMQELADKAAEHKAALVTTAKDAVRLAPEWRSLVLVLDIALEPEDPAALQALLDKVVPHEA